MKQKIDERMFKAVKAMTASGSTIQDISEVAKISKTTISRIRKSLDFEDYQDEVARQARIIAERKKRKEPAKADPVCQHTVMVQVNQYVVEELRKQNELLTGISAKLAFIVDELCGVSAGRC